MGVGKLGTLLHDGAPETATESILVEHIITYTTNSNSTSYMFQVDGVFLPPQTPPKKRANTYSSYHLVYHIFGCAVSEVNIRMDWNMKLLLVHILACVLVP